MPSSRTSRRSLATSSAAVIVLAFVAGLTLPALRPGAAKASPRQVIADCADDGTLSRRYSQRDLAGALNSLPADLDEYSDCRGVIEDALANNALGSHHRRSELARLLSTIGPSAARPEDHAALTTTLDRLSRERTLGRTPTVRLDDGTVLRPDGGGALRAAGLVGPLPVPLVGALGALLALALVGSVLALRSKVPPSLSAFAHLKRLAFRRGN